MNQRGFVNILLIALVVVLAGVAGYFALNNQKISTPAPTLSPTPTSNTSEYPVWAKKLIAKEESGPAANPPASLTQCEYKNQTVYYLPPRCCDIGSVLYNENGNAICSPDGGFTGGGDGRCSDFFSTRQNCKVIWKDPR